MKSHYLATKFHIPLWRTNGVPRPRLLERLQSGLANHHKLTLISAPAGYGKTMLMAEWIAGLQDTAVSTTWLSLDETDNDPARFLSYWLAAFRSVNESLGQSAQSLLGMPQIPPPSAIFDQLINDLAGLDDRILLVLDDYHVIDNPQIHEALEYFLDHQPPQIHLAITTRSDPPFTLSRLRVRGQLTEIRAYDLRFTIDEARQFFNQAMQLNLEPEDVSTLEARTEGWAAGLQLAALAMQNLSDRRDFLAEFSGSHRYVIDYLLDEVLKSQPPKIRDFLQETAVLHRFNADLCQAVTGDSAAAEILVHLERANLFLVPLDDRRGWYRYHHLFADVLRAALPPETEPVIHGRAAGWFTDQGLLDQAIPHWLAVPDTAQAAQLIGRLAADWLKNGELQTLLGWLEKLPETAVFVDPDLISYKALSLLLTGQIDRARQYAKQARETFENMAEKTGLGRLLAIQAWFAMTGGKADCGALAQSALAWLDETDRFFRAIALIALGSDYAWNADLPTSSRVFQETYELGRQMGHAFITLGALANWAFNLLEMGQLRQAESLCRAALAEYVDNRGRPLPILGIIYSPLAAICYEQGRFDEAQAFARQGIELSQRLFSSVILGGDSEIVLARIAFHRGYPDEALALLEETAQAARQRNVMMVVYKTAVVRAEIQLLLGNLAEADVHLTELETQAQTDLPKTRQIFAHLRARYWAAKGQMEKARHILAELEQLDSAEGCLRRLMGVYVTQALLAQAEGNRAWALDAFAQALRLAAPEGYVPLFFPHAGWPTRPLLQASQAVAPELVAAVLVQALPAAEDAPTPADFLPEPLTEQEVRVLGLLVDGRSNQEIADELVISLGTAKWHVHNILQKLGVANRAQAIAKAHELNL
ncbi:MAG: tetratricopeptide repeat protein [Ardenticatenaceae bacterium]|nr:tetratricopeptide repeat protein [Ardenticatenaceae bacterium]